MRYAYPGRAIPIQPFLTPTDPKFMPDADAKASMGQSQDAANGGQAAPSGGTILHDRGSNAPTPGSSSTIFD